MPRQPSSSHCDLCRREQPLTFHHLIPRTVHSNKWFKKRYRRDEMTTRGLWLCRPCHRTIHRHFSEKELGRRLNTRDALLAEPVIARFVDWVKTQR